MTARLRCLLAPTDFSEVAEYAVRYALDLADQVGAKVDLIHAYMVPIPAFPEGELLMGNVGEELHREAQAMLQRDVELYREARSLGRALVQQGDPRDVIVSTAKAIGADLIVMGTHGRKGLKRAFLGSVAERVLRTAPCPVLVVRPMLTEHVAAPE